MIFQNLKSIIDFENLFNQFAFLLTQGMRLSGAFDHCRPFLWQFGAVGRDNFAIIYHPYHQAAVQNFLALLAVGSRARNA